MAAWPGGPCPACGDDVPARVVRCRNCGELLNRDLQVRPIDLPDLIELPEWRSHETPVDQTSQGIATGSGTAQTATAASEGSGVTAAAVPVHPHCEPRGVWLNCPHCRADLRIAAKYLGQHVRCKHCQESFSLAGRAAADAPKAAYLDCPHCRQELRVAMTLLGREVACRFCDGLLRVDPIPGVTTDS